MLLVAVGCEGDEAVFRDAHEEIVENPRLVDRWSSCSDLFVTLSAMAKTKVGVPTGPGPRTYRAVPSALARAVTEGRKTDSLYSSMNAQSGNMPLVSLFLADDS